MNTIKTSSLGTIKSVFNDNETNVHYYDILKRSFYDKVHGLEFAQPILQLGKGKIIWKVTSNGPFHLYQSLDAEKKKLFNSQLQSYLVQMAKILEVHTDKDFLEQIIEVPGEESLFYEENNGELRIILTEWGYVSDHHTRSHSVLKKMLPGTLKSFMLRFINRKDEPVHGLRWTLKSADFDQQAEADSEGIIRLNNLTRGGTLTVKSEDGLFEKKAIKIDTEEEYTIVVEQTCTLTFQVNDGEGRPVTDTTFLFGSDVYSQHIATTNEEGIFQVDHPYIDGDFKVKSSVGEELLVDAVPNLDQTYELVYSIPALDDEVPEHGALFDEEASSSTDASEKGSLVVLIRFLDELEKPIKGRNVTFGPEDTTIYTTDDEGAIRVESLPEDTEHTLTLDYDGSDWVKTFFHPTGQHRHTFIAERKTEPITLEFLSRSKKPIANQPLQVYGLAKNNHFTTDKDGFVTIDELQRDTTYCAFMHYKGSDWKQDFAYTGENHLQFMVKHRRFLWWWIPLVALFFLFLSLMPTQIKHRYTVLERNSEQPIPGASIQNIKANIFQSYSGTTQTDSQGKLTVKYGKYPIYRQIFQRPSTTINASKLGYRSLTAKVPLGFFRTWRSYVYLEKISPPKPTPPPEEPPGHPEAPVQECNSGGDGGNHSSLIQYDLKVSQGTFILEFDLYNVPDEIYVYNCEASEIQNHTPIYSYKGSNGQAESIEFKDGPYITVEVLSEDVDSRWKYQVNCP